MRLASTLWRTGVVCSFSVPYAPGLEGGCLQLSGPPPDSTVPGLHSGGAMAGPMHGMGFLDHRSSDLTSAWFILSSGKGIFTSRCRLTQGNKRKKK